MIGLGGKFVRLSVH